MTPDRPRLLWAPAARLSSGWHSGVLLEINPQGHWGTIQTDVPAPADAQRLKGALVPGLVNAHSHAFQRGFAGLTEWRAGERDDFWSWREQMYALALRVSVRELVAIASQLYIELLEGGYTQVCEFHYLHHDRDGMPFADPLAMSLALAEAASRAGIGLTLLPVLYERAGFSDTKLNDRQRRFRASPRDVLTIRNAVRRWNEPLISAGVAIHSLRAASASSIADLVHAVGDDDAPIHIHIAEQQAEVRDCLAATGQRPISWLTNHVAIDDRWHLVHATHADAADQEAVAYSGAHVIVCPTTEANLGDGRFDYPGFSGHAVGIALGSDSHICRNWAAEIRLLEYSQRLALERRNVAARPEQGLTSSAEAILESALSAGARSAGLRKPWGLVPGARADALELDLGASGLLGIPTTALIDAAVFACDTPPVASVWVAGALRVSRGRHLNREQVASQFIDALSQLKAA